MREFIEGWDILQLLGEGNFARVKLLVNRETGEACAMKEIELELPNGNNSSPNASFNGSFGGGRALTASDEDSENSRFGTQDSVGYGGSGNYPDKVKKEIALHKLAKHPNIVSCYGSRLEGSMQYIFLEYCCGGELFDRIEPETGMPEHMAQNYFLQLMSAVEYIHSVGIVHRDIKPENILLTKTDQLKLTDFGLATVFRHKGKERKLERPCGTFPYMAPEVLTKSSYPAEPSDIWCCGMVLMAMLVGELPWGRALPEEQSYLDWRSHDYTKSPFNRIDNLPLSLIRKILCPVISKRYRVENIKNHLWCKKVFKDNDGNLIEPELVSPPVKRHHHGGVVGDDYLGGGLSQPAHLAYPQRQLSTSSTGSGVGSGRANGAKAKESEDGTQSQSNSSSSVSKSQEKLMNFGAFSQPAMMTNYYSGTQHSSQGSGSSRNTQSTHFQRLVRRMTRFWVDSNVEKTEKFLKGIVPKLGFAFTKKARGIYVIEAVDRRGAALSFKTTFISVDNRILVDFRLVRGCGLEFKKQFNMIRVNCEPIIDKTPVMWANLLEPDSIPGPV